MEKKTDWQKLVDRKDKTKMTDKQKQLVILKAYEVLGASLIGASPRDILGFNFWASLINDKMNEPKTNG